MNLTLARASSELTERVQLGLDRTAFGDAVLEVLERYVGCETGLCSTFEGGGPFTLRNLDGQARGVFELLEQRPERYVQNIRETFTSVFQSRGWIDHQVFPLKVRREDPVFRELFNPIGLRSVMMLGPRWRGRPLGIVGLHRFDRRRFSTAQLERALQILPVLDLAFALQERVRRPGEGALPELTPREHEIAHHVARGLSTPQIALVLGSSPFTVRNQLTQIFDKLMVASRAELAALVAQRQVDGRHVVAVGRPLPQVKGRSRSRGLPRSSRDADAAAMAENRSEGRPMRRPSPSHQ
jgi:DNA-binding CsgD family transcriptional regulator